VRSWVSASRAWLPSVVTLILLGAAAIGVERLPWPRSDFPPFAMTIEEWNRARVGYADGTTKAGTETYRLEYRARDDWTLTLIGDDVLPVELGQGWRCDHGTYATFDARGKVTVRSHDQASCDGVARWIHYGLSRSQWWQREVFDGQVVYTSYGERVVFDAATGLPLLYEAGLSTGSAGERSVFRLERYGP